MRLFLKNWFKKNWKSICGALAAVFLWILVKENILGLSYPTWGYLIFSGIGFDGIDDRATATDTGLPSGNSARTITFWFKSSHSGSTRYFMGYGNAANDQAIGLGIQTDGFVLFTNFGGSFTTSPFTVNDGNWHFLVFTQTGSSQVIYIDDVQRGTGSLTVNTVLNEFVFGDFINAFNVYLNCVMTELAIWNTVLGASDRAQLYNAEIKHMPHQIQQANRAEYWPMDNGPDGASADGDILRGVWNGNDGTGDNGANNTGLTWKAEEVLSYPVGVLPVIFTPSIIGAIMNQLQGPNLGADLFDGTLM